MGIILLNLQACAQMTFEEKMESLYKGTVPLIRSSELVKRLSTSDKLILLDIRSAEEFEVSRINGASLLAYDSFSEDQVAHLSKDMEIIVYCSVGYRSERVGEKLIKLGFTNVKNLYGGIFDWKNNGQIVINPSGEITDSVHTYNKNWSQWLYKGTKIYE